MTDQPTTSLRRRAAGIAASALVLANVLASPALALASGGPGTPPTLVNDIITTAEDTPATGNVLSNDVNSSGITPFTVTSFTQPGASVGTLSIGADGAYTFTPAPNFSGSGSATYMASNTKHEVGPATITINVTPTQDPPTASDDTITVNEDTATDVTSAILANDSDPDGDTLSVTGASNATGGNVDFAAGVVTFTPSANACGTGLGSFDYTMAATGGTSGAHVTVNVACVNDAPHAVNDTASGDEDTDVQIAESDLVANDTDVEGDSLSVSGVSNASGGSVDRSGGTVTFTPAKDLCGNGAASFDYTVSDGNGGTDTGHVTIDLTCEPEPPVANDDTISGTEDTDVVVSSDDLTSNDTDADGDTLTVTDVTNASGGTVDLTAGTITFTPAADACGTGAGSFDYTVDDGGNGGSDTGHVSVDLDCVNDAPVAVDDTVTVDEDSSATDVTASILGNDTDAEGDTLSVTDATNATGGTVDLTAGVVTFTPDADACGAGAGSFDYTVSDGTDTADGHVTVDVTCENDAPVASDDTANGSEDTAVVIDGSDLTANDSDVDSGDHLSVADVTNATGGTVDLAAGVVTFTPNADACDPDAFGFDYTLSDGNGGTDTGHVTINVECVNDAPVAVDDTVPGTEDTDVVISDMADLTGNDTDVDNDNADLSVVSESAPTGGTVTFDNETSSIVFHPTANLCGTGAAGFDYTISDGAGGFDKGHVTIDLDCANDNPTAVDDVATVAQDSAAAGHDVLGNDSDIDGDSPLTVSDVEIDDAAHGTASTDGTVVTYTPAAGFAGTAVITYTLSDGNGGFDMAALTITVTATPPSDTTPPTAHAPAVAFGAGRVDSTAPLRITWSATDPSGIRSYEVQVKVGTKAFAAVYTGTATSITKFYPFKQDLVFRMRATDAKGNVSAWATAATRKLAPYQNKNTSKKLVYFGSWHQVLAPAASGNGYAYTTVSRNRVTLTFTGRSVLYVAPRSKASGYVKVLVDGKLLGRFNLHTQTAQMGAIIASKTWSANGTHVIRVVNDQGGKRANFDAFIVLK